VTVVLAIVLAVAVIGIALLVAAGIWLFRDGTPRAARGSGNQLEEELRRAQTELRRARQLASLTDTFDLDELLSRVLQAAAVGAEADAAAVVLWTEGEPPLIKSMNLGPDEALPLLGAWRPEGSSRAVTIRYRFPGDSVGIDGVQMGVLLPLSADPDPPLGTVAVFWRRAADEPKDDQLAELEDLARTAGRAIENARRFGELRELADRDPLSGLHNRRYFHETLAHEVKRAHRYDRRLALIFFDLDDFKAINEEIGHLGGDGVLAEVAQRLRSVVRGADIPCRVGGDEFAVILPESSLDEAETFFQRLQLALAGQPIGRIPTLQVSAGIAELARDDDSTSLFRRVDQALYRAKRSGKGKVVAADEPEER